MSDAASHDERIPIHDVLPGISLRSIEGTQEINFAFVLVKFHDTDEDRQDSAWAYRTSSAPNREELLRALRVQEKLLEKELTMEWSAEVSRDDDVDEDTFEHVPIRDVLPGASCTSSKARTGLTSCSRLSNTSKPVKKTTSRTDTGHSWQARPQIAWSYSGRFAFKPRSSKMSSSRSGEAANPIGDTRNRRQRRPNSIRCLRSFLNRCRSSRRDRARVRHGSRTGHLGPRQRLDYLRLLLR